MNSEREEGSVFLGVLVALLIGIVVTILVIIGHSLAHQNDLIVVYEAGEVSEGFKEMERASMIAEEVENIEITMIAEDEFTEVVEEEYVGNPNIPLPLDLQKFIEEKCEEYSVNEAIVLAIMESESTFREAVGSEKILGGTEGGARYYGYMQLSAANCNRAYKDYGLNAHTKEGNIEMGIILLSSYIEKYGELDSVITAYKAGEGYADTGKKLKVCDEITDRVMYWEEVITER